MRTLMRSRPNPTRVLARLPIRVSWNRPARSPAVDEFTRDARRKRKLIYILDALLLVVALGVTYAIVRLRNPPSRANEATNIAAPATAVPLTRAEAWLAGNVSTTVRVGVDATVAHHLADARRPNVDVLSDGGTGWPADRFIVATPELRAEAPDNPAIAGAFNSSRQVAVFGTGADRVEVRQVAPDGPSALAFRWSQDVTDRTVAGAGLLHNPRVHEDAASSAVLRRGALDLRAVVLVGLLAANTNVRILGITADKAEAAAGMPARQMRMSIGDPARWLAATVATMPRAYRPSSITVLPGGARGLAWHVALAPVASVS